LHELSHFLACLLVGVRVTRTKSFGLHEAFIEHSKPGEAWKTVFISLTPFLLSNVFSVVFLFIAHEGVKHMSFFSFQKTVLVTIFYWLALSAAFHSFPSNTGVRQAWQSTWHSTKEGFLLKKGITGFLVSLLTLPLAVLILATKFLISTINKNEKTGFVWFLLLFFATAMITGV